MIFSHTHGEQSFTTTVHSSQARFSRTLLSPLLLIGPWDHCHRLFVHKLLDASERSSFEAPHHSAGAHQSHFRSAAKHQKHQLSLLGFMALRGSCDCGRGRGYQNTGLGPGGVGMPECIVSLHQPSTAPGLMLTAII